MVKSDRSYGSAIIDPYGRIVEQVVAADGKQATLVADVEMIQTKPFQHILADEIGWQCLAGMVFLSFLQSTKQAG